MVSTGKIVQVIGPVVDVEFPIGQLPDIYHAITVKEDKRKINLTLEAAQHLGNNLVRCVAMSSTDGLQRGMVAENTGQPIAVPVGEETLGRMFNVIGEAIDEQGAIQTEAKWPIHRPAPALKDQEPATEILETGIKVIDLLAPYAKGGKIGLFGG
ncbi:MAG: F0F1 ATP synthase subunit beta, partial [Clostridia bacterium]|nr:F0F1 ATP synthase subunit beta [Clostridia bacterium]